MNSAACEVYLPLDKAVVLEQHLSSSRFGRGGECFRSLLHNSKTVRDRPYASIESQEPMGELPNVPPPNRGVANRRPIEHVMWGQRAA